MAMNYQKSLQSVLDAERKGKEELEGALKDK